MALPALFAGATVTAITLSGRSSVAVRFRTSYANRLWQLYVGRRLLGVTNSTAERVVTGSFVASLWPEPLQLVGVDPSERNIDYSTRLHDRPYNRRRLICDLPSDADLERVEVTKATARGGNTDDTTAVVVQKVVAGQTRAALDLPQITRRGTWKHRVWTVDSKPKNGNRTEYAETNIPAAVYPRDFAGQSRFSVASITGNQVQLSVVYPS